MANIKVDGTEIEVPDHYTLLQAAEAAGLKSRVFVSTNGFPSLETAACALLK